MTSCWTNNVRQFDPSLSVVDHFIMKKEIICHIFVIWDTEVTKRFTQALFTRYRITYVSDPFSHRTGVLFIRLCMSPIRSAPSIRTTLLRISRWYENRSLQSIQFCFTYKHCNPIRNALKLQFDNRIASTQMRLIDCLASRQRKQQIWWT